MKAKNIYNNLNQIINKWDGGRTKYDIAPYYQIIENIKNAVKAFENISDDQLRELAKKVRTRLEANPHLENDLAYVYALVYEVFKRTLSIQPYDVQLIGAIALHEGNVIEMQTGEGKTFTAVFPAILNGLTGKGVHILTYNDYLAKRDADWMRPVYEFFDLQVLHIAEGMDQTYKKTAYRADITYATAKELGFDYLRSSMAYTEGDQVLRDLNFAIIDEADALMIDEARNPLVLAGEMEKSPIDPYEVAGFVMGMVKDKDYCLNEYSTNLYLSDIGIQKVERHYGISNLFDDENNLVHSSINLALQAAELLHRDIDYVVKEDRIKLVDELTGRIVDDRKWQNGLQTAVEAKERLPLQTEGKILGSISIQHLMKLYPKLAGMTGTARAASDEFDNFYDLGVVVIPPNKPLGRIDYDDAIFADKASKYLALIEEIKSIHHLKRPILIGTLTIKESEELHAELNKHQLYCEVLNAKNDALEAQLISRAGRLGTITISTNMAGRGTDILLGGGDSKERLEVVNLGGLHIIGTNRHESIRIDDQLRGRAGRQGDPGSSKFFISLEDDLMVRYKLGELLPKKYRQTVGKGELKDRIYAHTISQAQRIISSQMFEIRKTLFNYTTFVEHQRKFILGKRQEVLLNQHINKGAFLNQWDLFWTNHLNYTLQLRAGIYWERIGGNDPLRVFFHRADVHFRETLRHTEEQIKKLNNHKLDLPVKRPSSTWTYIVNDNPFQNKVAIMLTGSGNMGYQIDFLVGPVMFLAKIINLLFKTKSK